MRTCCFRSEYRILNAKTHTKKVPATGASSPRLPIRNYAQSYASALAIRVSL